ncbi:transposase [Ureaplasma sp. ES3154-GEN]|uniref:transposase n=1 Tax=Ureaplasma sp. ES3154-GEN TaxID=2984844 RepID=UPI0021E86476|nr:transposase [Ureaplasma sp. ES3154-GEN]MCV3743411.1 transposase [Ureaplasma sp. ES3154-GEN]
MQRKQQQYTLLGDLYKYVNPTLLQDIHMSFRLILKQIVELMLAVEFEHFMGYRKYHMFEGKKNYRNGSFKKTIFTQFGDLLVSVPRDRNCEFQTSIINRYCKHLGDVQALILDLFVLGCLKKPKTLMIKHMYGISPGTKLMNLMHQRIDEFVARWWLKPVEAVYSIVFVSKIDLSFYRKSKQNHRFALVGWGINSRNELEIIGLYKCDEVDENPYSEMVANWQSRGIKEIHILMTAYELDNIAEHINAVYPKTQLMDNSSKILKNDLNEHGKEIIDDLNKVYNDGNLENWKLFVKKWC